ncbi:hypothetical protein [Nocardioides sp.]|uniref:hypothetical protein n=1 Tax=Nocardioides sp. TaxID=35761 RepID=UPI003D0E7464
MEFDDYVTARRATLVRVSVLLGCPDSAAPSLVAGVLARSSREIKSADDPDPEVHRALMGRIAEVRDTWPPESAPAEDARNEHGLRVRRELAALDPLERAALVLTHYADLTAHETADALRTKPTVVLEAAAAARRRWDGIGDLQVADRLQAAADTVEIHPAGRIVPAPPRRRWPWLVAIPTAAVVAVVAVALTRPAPPKDDDRLRADQIPSVFGYDAPGARDLLEARGLKVRDELARACEVAERALSSDPPAGSRFERGDTVTVFAAAPSGPDCDAHYGDRTDAWEFIDFATGRGPAPDFADHVYLVVNGGVPITVTAAEARASATWRDLSAMSELREAVRQVIRLPNGNYDTPNLGVSTVFPHASVCGVRRPLGAGAREALELTVTVPGSVGCPLTVDLYRNESGIDAIVLYTAKPAARKLSAPPWATHPRG